MRCKLGDRCDHHVSDRLAFHRPLGWRKGDPKDIMLPNSLERHLEVIDALQQWKGADRRSTGILGHVELEFL